MVSKKTNQLFVSGWNKKPVPREHKVSCSQTVMLQNVFILPSHSLWILILNLAYLVLNINCNIFVKSFYPLFRLGENGGEIGEITGKLATLSVNITK